MIPTGPAPTPDELVETLFAEVLLPPEGYEYHGNNGQLLFPVFGQDRWRILLHKKDTDFIDKANFTPVFLEGAFILKLTKALNAMQRELNQAVSEEIPEPVGSKVVM
jgi:hypothetical protein